MARKQWKIHLQCKEYGSGTIHGPILYTGLYNARAGTHEPLLRGDSYPYFIHSVIRS